MTNRFTDCYSEKQSGPIGGYWKYPLVSLKDALTPVLSKINGLDRDIKEAYDHCHFPSEHGLTKDEAAAVFLYTLEAGEYSFYAVLNRALREEDRRKLTPWFSYLKLFDTALEKLPTVKGCIWRGVPQDVSKDYVMGTVKTWWSVNSCSSLVKIVEDFLSSVDNSTLFMIEATNGKDLTGYTNYPDEKEVLLKMGTKLRVKSNAMKHDKLHIIHLVEIDNNDHAETPATAAVASLASSSSSSISAAAASYVKPKPKPLTQTVPIPPLRAPAIDIHPNARWQQNGLTVAGGNGKGNGNNQLSEPWGLYIDDDQTSYIADKSNHRIIEWKWNATSGQVVAGGNEKGNEAHQLSCPLDVIVDKERDNLIICDWGNRRVVRWPRRNGTSGETIISNIDCVDLTMDENGSLYIIDEGKHEVRRYRRGESEGTVVAGGNGRGNRLDQLSSPQFVFVDRDHSVYVSEYGNHRVMKWMESAKQGIVVAGGQGQGNSLRQLSSPGGVVVDQLGTVYVADMRNARIMRWMKGATQGNIIVGGNGEGRKSNQFNDPIGLSFDRHGNLYVVDWGNHRVQKFNIEFNG